MMYNLETGQNITYWTGFGEYHVIYPVLYIISKSPPDTVMDYWFDEYFVGHGTFCSARLIGTREQILRKTKTSALHNCYMFDKRRNVWTSEYREM